MPVPFLQTRAGQCLYPVSGEGRDMKVCGETARFGEPYCAACKRIAYEPSTRRVGALSDPMVIHRRKPIDDPVELTGVLA